MGSSGYEKKYNKSICFFKMKEKIGIGFLCLIHKADSNETIPVLITNSTFLPLSNTNPREKIEFTLNKKNHSLSIDESRKIFSNENEYNISSYQILNELEKEDNLELMDENKLTRYTEMKDPYSNIKEEEFNRLLNIKEKDKIRELGEGENKIKAFSCALSSQIISRGTLMITNKKIEFNSSFLTKVQIIIPLVDIISIKKKTSLGLDNSIQIITEKINDSNKDNK